MEFCFIVFAWLAWASWALVSSCQFTVGLFCQVVCPLAVPAARLQLQEIPSGQGTSGDFWQALPIWKTGYRWIQDDTRYIKKIKIHKLKFSKRSPLIWQNLANLVAIDFLSNVIKSCAGASSRLRMRHLYARNHFRGTFWLVMAVVFQKWSHFSNTSWVCQSSVAWSRLLLWLSNLRDFDVVENSFTNGCMKFCCEGRSADCNDTLWTSLSRVLLGKAGTNYSTGSFLLSLSLPQKCVNPSPSCFEAWSFVKLC